MADRLVPAGATYASVQGRGQGHECVYPRASSLVQGTDFILIRVRQARAGDGCAMRRCADASRRRCPGPDGIEFRGAAARARRSLIASPRPSRGIGITAMRATPARSSARRCENRLAAASIRSPRGREVERRRGPLGAGRRIRAERQQGLARPHLGRRRAAAWRAARSATPACRARAALRRRRRRRAPRRPCARARARSRRAERRRGAAASRCRRRRRRSSTRPRRVVGPPSSTRSMRPARSAIT